MTSPAPPLSVSRAALGLLGNPQARADMVDDPTIGLLVPIHLTGVPCSTSTIYPDADADYPESLAGGVALDACGQRVAGWVLCTSASGPYNAADARNGLPDPRRRPRLNSGGPPEPAVLILTPEGLAGAPGLVGALATVWRVGFGGPVSFVEAGEVVQADISIRWVALPSPASIVAPALRSAAVAARR